MNRNSHKLVALRVRLAMALASMVLGSILGLTGCDNTPPSGAAVETPSFIPALVHQSAGADLLHIGGPIPGMTVTEVRQIELPGVIEANGQIAYDQRDVAQIVSRVAGRIEATRAVLWDSVHAGQPIVRLYSPDFMTAEAEYLEGLKTRGLSPSGQGTIADAMVSAARRKLELLGMSQTDIAALTTPSPTVWMRAPISGTVVSNSANIGGAVNPGDVLYTLGTTNVVWITADIYEDELARIQLGQQLEAVTTAWPGEVFHGTIARISPEIDPATHAAKIRCAVNNPGGRLKPQMLARVRIITQPGVALLVPQAALVFETNAYYVFVDRGAGLFERRVVEIASWHESGFTRVTAGLNPGEKVVADESIQLNELWHQASGSS
ncbi:MAG TPA: efflux RND transporter periplasmic adaptor subunit [Candidatus Binataceae bacterium]|nr:efflux RND transporter periplasmic adaptor subunit [Candidatus Binataceae bacterium]